MISQDLLDAVICQTEQSVIDDALLARLRSAHPGAHFTACMDDDIVANAKPVATRPGFNLYLVNSSDHCLALTNDTASATGILVAQGR